MSAGRVHQVLATLGYGDAIGHEVLGIQRVLRAPATSPRSSSRPPTARLEHLTIDYRDMVGAIAPEDVLIHHFSIGSRASRTAYALPGRMALVYHNITPPEYFLGVHKDLVQALLPRPPRADRLHRALRAGARRLRVQPPGARGARLPPHRRAAGRARLRASRSCRPTSHDRRAVRRRLDQRDVRRPGDPEQEVRGRDPRLPRLPHAAQPALAAAAGRLVRRLRDVPGDAARARRAARHAGRPLPRPRLERGADGALRRRRPVPLRQRARRLLRAAHRERSTSACRCSPTPRRPCRRRWTAAACCTTRKDPFEVARADGGGPRRSRISRTAIDREPGRRARAAAGEGLRRHAAPLRRPGPRPPPPRRAPEVAFDFWGQFDQAERLEELRQFRPAAFRALPRSRVRGGGRGATDVPASRRASHR